MKRKTNKCYLLTGIYLILLGLYSLFIKSVSVEYIDSNGILQEKFFLLPLAFLFILIGIIVVALTIIIPKISKKK